MAKENSFREYIYPVIILTVICTVTTALLALTNYISAPVIEENQEKSARETRLELLPEADDFTDVTGDYTTLASNEKAQVSAVFKADNGSGFVYTVKTNSFGGVLTMMVGVDGDGAVTGVQVTDHADTPGVGTKNFDKDYLTQYKGRDQLTNENVKKEEDFAFITGASVTGTAIHEGVYAALTQFKEAQ